MTRYHCMPAAGRGDGLPRIDGQGGRQDGSRSLGCPNDVYNAQHVSTRSSRFRKNVVQPTEDTPQYQLLYIVGNPAVQLPLVGIFATLLY
jgi:hypothetical protein